MEVPCCPKCSKDADVHMRPNDPIVSFYSRESGNPCIRECNACGQQYCMSWKQWAVVILLNATVFAFLGMPAWELLPGPLLLCFGGIILAEPLIVDAAHQLFPWKPVDAPRLDSRWRRAIRSIIVAVSVYIGAHLIRLLLLGIFK